MDNPWDKLNHSMIAGLSKEKVLRLPSGPSWPTNLSHFESYLTYASGKYSIQSWGLCNSKILVFACNGLGPIKLYLSSQSFPNEPEAGEVCI